MCRMVTTAQVRNATPDVRNYLRTTHDVHDVRDVQIRT